MGEGEEETAKFKLLLEAVRPLAEVRAERTRGVLLSLRGDQLDDGRIMALRGVVANHAGACKLQLQVVVDDRYQSTIAFGDTFGVSADEGLLLDLERLFGRGVARLV
jgi:DNA polymerase-3 subunit alpha